MPTAPACGAGPGTTNRCPARPSSKSCAPCSFSSLPLTCLGGRGGQDMAAQAPSDARRHGPQQLCRQRVRCAKGARHARWLEIRGRGLKGPGVWRICFNGDLRIAGLPSGSTLGPGRWHVPPPSGLPVVYAASSRALAQLEKRVHANGVAPVRQALIRLKQPQGAILLDAQGGLGPGVAPVACG